MLTGGCYCGAIRYEIDGVPFEESVCHCTICRRTTGAPHVAWFSVARAGFRLRGEPARFRSSPRAVRSFCPRCGAQLLFERDDLPNELDVTTGSLDEPDRIPPKDHIHWDSAPAWGRVDDGLPRFAGERTGTRGGE